MKMGISSSNMSDFLIFIYKTLQENNIEIPFPQNGCTFEKKKYVIILDFSFFLLFVH